VIALLIGHQPVDRILGTPTDDNRTFQTTFAIALFARQQMPATSLASDDLSASGPPESLLDA